MAINAWLGGDVGNETDPNVAANWSLNLVPAAAQDIVYPKEAAYNCDGHDFSGVSIKTLTVEEGCTITRGTSLSAPLYWTVNSGAAANYVRLGGTGITYEEIDSATQIHIRRAATGATANDYGLTLWGASIGEIIVDIGNTGSVILSPDTVELCKSDLFRIRTGAVTLGPGCTTTAPAAAEVEIFGGTVATYMPMATCRKTAGTLTHWAGAVANLYEIGGITYYRAIGLLSAAEVGSGARLDYSQDARPRSVGVAGTSSIRVHKGGTLWDPDASVTFLEEWYCENCSLNECTINVGIDRAYLPSAIP